MNVYIDLIINRSPSIIGALLVYKFISTVIIGSIDTINGKKTWVHLGGGFVSAAYVGYGLDPEAMILRELLQVTDFLGGRFIFHVLTAMSLIELIAGLLIISEKRGRYGAIGHVFVAISGWLLVEWRPIAILMTIGGWLMFSGSEEKRF